jgi:hypothetical protein
VTGCVPCPSFSCALYSILYANVTAITRCCKILRVVSHLSWLRQTWRRGGSTSRTLSSSLITTSRPKSVCLCVCVCVCVCVRVRRSKLTTSFLKFPTTMLSYRTTFTTRLRTTCTAWDARDELAPRARLLPSLHQVRAHRDKNETLVRMMMAA